MSDTSSKAGAAIMAGPLVSSTFSVWARNFPSFLAMTLIIYAPITVLSLYSALTLELTQESIDKLQRLGIVEVFLSMICTAALSGAVCQGTLESLRGRGVSFGQLISSGLPRALAVIGTSMLAGLAIAGGIMLLIIPGLIVATMVVAAVPATAIERLGPIAALKRSAKLSEGHRGQIFGAIFVIGLVTSIPSVLINKVIAERAQTLGDVQLAIYLELGLTLLTAPLFAVFGTVVYRELRENKEGIDADSLAAVFS